MSHVVVFEVLRQSHGNASTAASEMKSRALAQAMRSLRPSVYSKRYGAADTRLMKPIQNRKLDAKMMNHGQFPRSAPKLPSPGVGVGSAGMVS